MTGQVQAVIFDLDGTVLDNEQVWEEAFARVVAGNGLKVLTAMRQVNGWVHEPGIGLEANWRRLVNAEGDQAHDLSGQVKAAYRELAQGELRLREGIGELIEKVKERGVRTALATTTFWHVVEEELELLQMELAFDVTTTGDEVVLQKPDPEIYALTAQKLEADPKECLVVEDAVAGVRAAVEAGMQAVGLVSDYAPGRMLAAAGAKPVKKLGEVIDILNIL
jgi:HAD superfamily hydrolase (TIGR01509 family)